MDVIVEVVVVVEDVVLVVWTAQNIQLAGIGPKLAANQNNVPAKKWMSKFFKLAGITMPTVSR